MSQRFPKNFRTARRLKYMLGFLLIGPIFGGPFNYFASGRDLESFMSGVLVTFFIALLAGSYFVCIADQRFEPYLRRLPFLAVVVLNTCVYFVLFNVGRLLGEFVRFGNVVEAWNSADEVWLVGMFLAFFFILASSFIFQMNLLVGQNVLSNFVTGKYRRPKAEQRYFLFADMVDSTKLAESLGNMKFHELLVQVFEVLTEPILEARGEIYEYVGDEIIVSWKAGPDRSGDRCAECALNMQHSLDVHEASFVERFGVVPRIRIALHVGEVIVGQLGVAKQKISFLGDVLNTTARIVDRAKEEGVDFLTTAEVVNRIRPPEGYEWQSRDSFTPRGKQEEIHLYTCERTIADVASAS